MSEMPPELIAAPTCAACSSTELSQSLPHECLSCGEAFDVRCTGESFWMHVKPVESSVCPECRSVDTQLQPGAVKYRCESCGFEAVRQQGL